MRSAFVLLLVFAATAYCASAKADEQSDDAEALAEHLAIVDVTDSTPFDKLQGGQLARITASTPSGGKIAIAINGPGRLVWVVDVTTVKKGNVQIGELKKEFVFRKKIVGQGPVKVEVTTTPPSGAAETKSYEFEWK